MKYLRLVMLGAVLLALTACSAGLTVPTPAATPIPLPPRTPAIMTQAAPASTPTPRAAVPTTVAATSPTPTWVLRAPLPTGVPAILDRLSPPATATPAVTATPAAHVVAYRPALKGRLVVQTASGGDIVLVDLATMNVMPLTNGLDPAWSPDGRQIAFTRWTEPQGVYVINADGGGLRLVHEIKGPKSPTWSPDGSKVAFTWKYKTERSEPPRGAPPGLPVTVRDFWKVSVVDVATGSRTDMPMDNDGSAFVPSWGADGRIVYKGIRGLWLTDQAGPPVRLTDNPLQDSPAWSPDGRRMALSFRQHDHWDIALINADGSGLTALTSSPVSFGVKPVNNAAPAWSPDGTSIVFLSDRDGDWHLYVMSADGSGQRRLLDLAVRYDYASERVVSWSN